MKLGAQLYTVRAFTKDLDSFSQTLARVAEMGYTSVQVSGTCEFDPAWLAAELKKNGLVCPLTHTSPTRILENTEEVCRNHLTFGATTVGLGSMPDFKNLDDGVYERFVESFLPAAKAIKENGCKFAYHHHNNEFARSGNGQTYMERILADFPVELLDIICDTYWLQAAGTDPAVYLRNFAGRAKCIHLKDMTVVIPREQHYAPIGHGNMNFGAILSTAEDIGTEYLLVEQDDCYGEDPFACLQKSYDYLHSLGLS